jgi:TM2 domain-containing membrane protein YozV
MTKEQKKKVSLLRTFLGYFGVDAFVMGKIGQAVTRLVMGIILLSVEVLFIVLAIVLTKSVFTILAIVVGVVLVLRLFLYFLGGLLMLNKPEEEVEDLYK